MDEGRARTTRAVRSQQPAAALDKGERWHATRLAALAIPSVTDKRMVANVVSR
jgi:hypothetical protein